MWVFEPVELFGISDPEDGMICAEWNANRLCVYYHSPEDIELGELAEREAGRDE